MNSKRKQYEAVGITLLILIIPIAMGIIYHFNTVNDLKERLSWCNTNSCYTADATDNDECHRLLAQEPTSTCQNYLDQCNARVDRYDAMLVECQEMAITAQDHWQMWMDEAAACYGVSE